MIDLDFSFPWAWFWPWENDVIGKESNRLFSYLLKTDHFVHESETNDGWRLRWWFDRGRSTILQFYPFCDDPIEKEKEWPNRTELSRASAMTIKTISHSN